jgi:UDP-3-O-[3-hydroxymyristoyl] N-acetylglucosamine deacetylase
MLQALRKSEVETMPRGKILSVDDEPEIRSSLRGVLKDEGFEIETAQDAEACLEKVRSSNPDVVLLDIWMPGRDGVQILSELKEINPLLPIIVISGHATIQNALDATRKGAFDFIEKPFQVESILLSIDRALERTSKEKPSIENVGVLYDHPGHLSSGLKGRNVGQRTLKRGALLYGHCLHSGQKSGLILEPLPLNSGIHFAPIGDAIAVPAHVSFVQSTGFATTVRSGTSSAATIEHLMSSLHAYGISNLLIKCNGEVPIFDGSAAEFCRIIEDAGIEEQGGDWFEIAPDRTFETSLKNGKLQEKIKISPADSLEIRYELNYPSPVGVQVFEIKFPVFAGSGVDPAGIEKFKQEIAPARTFGFMKDIEKLQKAGLAAGGRLDNFILIGDTSVVNTALRFPDELARHKALDAIGDLFLIGRPIRARIEAVMTGHSDNVEILKSVWAAISSGTTK